MTTNNEKNYIVRMKMTTEKTTLTNTKNIMQTNYLYLITNIFFSFNDIFFIFYFLDYKYLTSFI